MKDAVEIETAIIGILTKSGVRNGDKVIDFGCGSGDYAIPAAKIVGERGAVYAVDRDKGKLEELRRKIRDRKIENIVPVDAAKNSGKNGGMDFENGAADVVLLFDVLHQYYFPSVESRRRVLREICRLLKPGALLLVHPTHVNQANIIDEIEHAGFQFVNRRAGNLIHDVRQQRSAILVFARE
ncbi:MAG: class I SAM-dependent methyltransferase [Spirochaetales bacterium]|nr:class I SAM-dependent methyltransferase [Spirochaetales bacterium]